MGGGLSGSLCRSMLSTACLPLWRYSGHVYDLRPSGAYLFGLFDKLLLCWFALVVAIFDRSTDGGRCIPAFLMTVFFQMLWTLLFDLINSSIQKNDTCLVQGALQWIRVGGLSLERM